MPAPSLITLINPLRFIYTGVPNRKTPPATPRPIHHCHPPPLTMASITKTYLLPAIFLNPVLILHTFNTILSRMPTTLAASSSPSQSIPFYGPSATQPYFNVHDNDNLCWTYTFFMVGVQLVAFGRVSGIRNEDRRVKAQQKREAEEMRKALDTEEETEEEMA